MLSSSIHRKAQDSAALNDRIEINNQQSKRDLNQWIISLLSLKPTDIVLDLCCGRGAQTAVFALRAKKVYAADISSESLSVINNLKLNNVEPVALDLNEFSSTKQFPENFFDYIHCAYGLYYAQDAADIIQQAYKLLKSDGMLIVVGPTDDNNRELFSLVERVYPIDEYIVYTSRDFMNTLVLPAARKFYQNVGKHYFENEITYPDAESLYAYIKSSTMYQPEYDEKLRLEISKFFTTQKSLVVTKKVMAVLARK